MNNLFGYSVLVLTFIIGVMQYAKDHIGKEYKLHLNIGSSLIGVLIIAFSFIMADKSADSEEKLKKDISLLVKTNNLLIAKNDSLHGIVYSGFLENKQDFDTVFKNFKTTSDSLTISVDKIDNALITLDGLKNPLRPSELYFSAKYKYDKEILITNLDSLFVYNKIFIF